jgi:hypothetical protein
MGTAVFDTEERLNSVMAEMGIGLLDDIKTWTLGEKTLIA